MARLRLLLTGLVVWFAAFAANAIAADFTKPGPLAVGVQKFAIPDITGKHPMATTVWYPAIGPAPDPTGTILKVAKDAPPATSGPYPLVLLIHGAVGVGAMYATLGSQLASYGFVVAAANYDGGLDEVPGEGVTYRDRNAIVLLYNRPADVVRVIEFADTLTAMGGKLAGIIDASHIGVWGHSTGGSTAFQAGGAQIDFKELDAWCAEHNKESTASETCQFVGSEQVVATHYGAANPFAAPMPPIWDHRVAALVAGAPGGELHAFGDTGIAAVKVPALIMYAANDEVVFPEYNAVWAYDGIGSQHKSLAVFDDGKHGMFLYSQLAQFKVATALATAFFLDILKGDAEGRAALMPDALSFPGLNYRTTFH
jgi:predicted dienelactone hydrolase